MTFANPADVLAQGEFSLMTFANPADVLAQGESDNLVSTALVSYCSGFQSQLPAYSAKEKALLQYHQKLALEWDADVSFQAGATSSGRLLEELNRGADNNDLRIVISRVVGEVCGLASGERNLLTIP